MHTLQPADERNHKIAVDGEVVINASVMSSSGTNYGVILSHPYPPLGGDKNNNVIRELAHEIRRLNVSVLRYDMRGAGGSTGRTSWRSTAEARDLESIASWWKTQSDGPMKIILLGYSYGALVTMIAANAVLPFAIGLVSIPSRLSMLLTMRYSIDELIAIPNSTSVLLVHGSKDQLSSTDHANAFLSRTCSSRPGDMLKKVEMVFVPEGDHFWVGKEELVVTPVKNWIEKLLKTSTVQCL